jgi:hypothetical protein
MTSQKDLSFSRTVPTSESAQPARRGACRNKTWAQAAGQRETSVVLQQLPPGVEFPDDFPEPIRYEPAHKLLRYRGMMFHGSYEFLHALSSERAYLVAIDGLYIGSSESPRQRAWLHWLAACAAVGIGALVFWLLR